MLFQLAFVVLYRGFTYQLLALDPAFVDDDLVVLSQLYFIIFDGLVEGLVLVASLLDVVDYLEEVDGD